MRYRRFRLDRVHFREAAGILCRSWLHVYAAQVVEPHLSCYNLDKIFVQETKRMNLYVTGNTIKQLREQKKMTQA